MIKHLSFHCPSLCRDAANPQLCLQPLRTILFTVCTSLLTKPPELTPTPWHQVTLGIQQDAAFVPCATTCCSAKHCENWQVLHASIKNGIMRSKCIFPLLPMFNEGKISI